MEGRISEALKHYGYSRSKILESFSGIQSVLVNNFLFHSILVVTTFAVIASVFAKSRSLTLFSLHPVFMSIGTLIFLAEGIVAYRNNSLLVTLGPIMQHGQRTKARSIHQSVQTVGGGFLFLGLLAILSNKIEYRYSLIPSTVHSIIGTVSILIIIMQITTGQQKMNQINMSNSKIRRWHGDAGLLLWDCLCITILTGLTSFLDMSTFTGLVLLLVILVWYTVHVQMTGLKSSMMPTDDSFGDADGPNVVDNDFVDSEPLLESSTHKNVIRDAIRSPMNEGEISPTFSSDDHLHGGVGLGAARV